MSVKNPGSEFVTSVQNTDRQAEIGIDMNMPIQ